MLGSIISFIGESYLKSKEIYNIIGTVLGVMLAYKAVYYAIGFYSLVSLVRLKRIINMVY